MAFLAQTDWAVASALEALFHANYPKGDGSCRPPIGLDRVLHIYFRKLCGDEFVPVMVRDSCFRLCSVQLGPTQSGASTRVVEIERRVGLHPSIFIAAALNDEIDQSCPEAMAVIGERAADASRKAQGARCHGDLRTMPASLLWRSRHCQNSAINAQAGSPT